jgi:hypothetical protein
MPAALRPRFRRTQWPHHVVVYMVSIERRILSSGDAG